MYDQKEWVNGKIGGGKKRRRKERELMQKKTGKGKWCLMGSKINEWLDRINWADGRGDRAGSSCCFITLCTCFLAHVTFPKVACLRNSVPIYMQWIYISVLCKCCSSACEWYQVTLKCCSTWYVAFTTPFSSLSLGVGNCCPADHTLWGEGGKGGNGEGPDWSVGFVRLRGDCAGM